MATDHDLAPAAISYFSISVIKQSTKTTYRNSGLQSLGRNPVGVKRPIYRVHMSDT